MKRHFTFNTSMRFVLDCSKAVPEQQFEFKKIIERVMLLHYRQAFARLKDIVPGFIPPETIVLQSTELENERLPVRYLFTVSVSEGEAVHGQQWLGTMTRDLTLDQMCDLAAVSAMDNDDQLSECITSQPVPEHEYQVLKRYLPSIN